MDGLSHFPAQVPTPPRMSPPSNTAVQIEDSPVGRTIVLPTPAWKGRFLCHFVAITVLFALCIMSFILIPLYDESAQGHWPAVVFILLSIGAAVFYVVGAWVLCSPAALLLTPDEVVLQRHLWFGWVTLRRVQRAKVHRVDLRFGTGEGENWPQSRSQLDNSEICIYTTGWSVKFGYYLSIQEKKWVLLEVSHYMRAPIGAGFFDLSLWSTTIA